jgi:hypothetical protein
MSRRIVIIGTAATVAELVALLRAATVAGKYGRHRYSGISVMREK